VFLHADIRTDRQTDRQASRQAGRQMYMTKIIVAFRKSANATKILLSYHAVNSPRLIEACQLMLYKEIFAVRSEINTKHRNLHKRKSEF